MGLKQQIEQLPQVEDEKIQREVQTVFRNCEKLLTNIEDLEIGMNEEDIKTQIGTLTTEFDQIQTKINTRVNSVGQQTLKSQFSSPSVATRENVTSQAVSPSASTPEVASLQRQLSTQSRQIDKLQEQVKTLQGIAEKQSEMLTHLIVTLETVNLSNGDILDRLKANDDERRSDQRDAFRR